MQTLAPSLKTARTIAIIMGGGAGTRLFPLTKDRAKPAVPLAGKYRLVDIPISNCLNSNLRKIYLLTQFNSSSLHRHIQRTYKFDEFSSGFVEILAAQQTPDQNAGWYEGTADAVRRNWIHFDNDPHDLVVILSGDQLYQMDYRDIIAEHLRQGADITVSTIPVSRQAAKGFGIMHIDNSNRIVRFEEKPQDENKLSELRLSPSTLEQIGHGMTEDLYLASMGIYVFNRHVLREVLANSFLDFGKDVIPSVIGKYRMYASIYQGYWEDIGTIKAFYNANLDLCNPRPQFNFFNRRYPIFTRPRFLPFTKIENSSLDHAIISDGCVVRDATLRHSLLGIRSIVGEGVTIENSIIMGADYYEGERNSQLTIPLGVGSGTRIKNAIIDKNVRIGRNCVISSDGKANEVDHPLYHIREGILVIPKNTVIEDSLIL